MAAALIYILPAHAHAGSYGTELPFVLGTSARASALGLAYTCGAADASSQYFNPSSLAHITYKQFMFYRTVLFDSKSLYHSMSYTHPLMYHGALGLTIMRLDIGGIEGRDSHNNLLMDNLKNSQTRILLGYGKTLYSSISAGFNLKLDYQSFGSYSSTGIGLDLGVTAAQKIIGPAGLNEIREGLMIRNLIEPSLKLDVEEVPDPNEILLGISVAGKLSDISYQTSLDLINPRYSPFQARFGQELSYQNIMSLRIGFEGSIPTYGLGAAFRNISVDYSYRTEDLDANHRISVAVRFGASTIDIQERERRQMELNMTSSLNSQMSAWEKQQVDKALFTADSLYGLREYDRARKYFEMAVFWNPDLKDAAAKINACRYNLLLSSAAALIRNEAYGRALAELKQAETINPRDAETALLIKECQKKMAEINNFSSQIAKLFNNAVELYADGRLPESLSLFDEVLRLDPANSFADEYRNKILLKYKMIKDTGIRKYNSLAAVGDYYAAITVLKTALEVNKGDKELLSLLQEAKRNNTARKTTRASAPSTLSSAAGQPVLSRAYSQQLEKKYKNGLKIFEHGQFETAARIFFEIWTAAPGFHDVTALLAKAYIFIGMKYYADEHHMEAIQTWEKALAVDPGNLKATRYLAKTRAEMKILTGM